MSLPRFVTRFAPSPTGYLHRGHAYSALTAFKAAQDAGGRFLLRIEDIDIRRCRACYEAAIYEDLAWLGLSWAPAVRRQSEHMGEYRQTLSRLEEQGLVYRCFRTRAQVLEEIASAPHGAMSAYRGRPLAPSEEARLIAEGAPYAWRLSLAEAQRRLGGFSELTFLDEAAGLVVARPELAGDVVLARKDLGVAYHLAVVVDDALQGVSDVIRGADLFETTHIQRLIQALLGLPTPAYRHHRLLTGPDGKRFAKRDKAETLRDLRARGLSREALLAELAL